VTACLSKLEMSGPGGFDNCRGKVSKLARGQEHYYQVNLFIIAIIRKLSMEMVHLVSAIKHISKYCTITLDLVINSSAHNTIVFAVKILIRLKCLRVVAW